MEIIEQIGSYAGLASVVGLAILSVLYFSQARDVKRLREWAGRAPERAADQPAVLQPVPGRAAGQPQPAPAQQAPRPGAPPPVPAAASAAGARPAATTPAAQGAQPAHAGANAGNAGAPSPATAQAAAAPAGQNKQPATAGANAGGATAPAHAQVAGGASAPAAAEAKAATQAPDQPAGAPTKPDAPAEAEATAATQAPTRPGGPEPSTPAAPRPGTPGDPRPAAPAVPGGSPAPGAPSTPAAARPQGASAAPAGTPPPSAARVPAQARPSPQQTVILPPPRVPWYRRLVANPRYLALAIAGVLIVGGGAAFGIVQLVGEDEGGGATPQASEGPARGGAGAGGGGGGERGEPRPAAVNPANVSVAVLNGTLVPGLAAQIGDRVERFGFRLGTVANGSDQQRAESVVLFSPGHRREAMAVGRRLGIPQRERVDPESQALAGDATVVVIAGADKTQ